MSSSSHTADSETGSNQRAAVRDHALAALADTHADGEIVKVTVLRELYRHHPAVTLEDTLELNVVVAAPEPGPLDECVDTVISEAVAQLDGWVDTASAVLGENTSLPATEER